MSPAEGERRLNSAIAASPGAESASLRRGMREPREIVEPCAGGSRLDRLRRESEPFAEIGGVAGGGDRAGRVEEDGVALPAPAAGEDVPDDPRVLLRGAAAQLLRVAALEAELGAVDDALDHLAAHDLAHLVR